MRSEVAIEIAAPGRLVFDLARDVARWPALLPHYLRVRVRAREQPEGVGAAAVVADMVAVRAILPLLGLGVPVAWRARTWAEAPGLRLRFQHLAGATRGMDVTWRIEPTELGCRVTIEHVFRPRIPGWAALVDRLFVRQIASRTLATFKAIAEAVVAAGAGAGDGAAAAASRSEPRPEPKTPA